MAGSCEPAVKDTFHVDLARSFFKRYQNGHKAPLQGCVRLPSSWSTLELFLVLVSRIQISNSQVSEVSEVGSCKTIAHKSSYDLCTQPTHLPLSSRFSLGNHLSTLNSSIEI